MTDANEQQYKVFNAFWFAKEACSLATEEATRFCHAALPVVTKKTQLEVSEWLNIGAVDRFFVASRTQYDEVRIMAWDFWQ